MYRLMVALLLGAGLVQTVSALEAQPRVIGGQDVTEVRPWMAEVEISRSSNPEYVATLCGGTLIAPRWVLGWGSTTPDGFALTETLQKADLDFVSQGYCASQWSNLTGNQICAGEMNPQGQKQDSCRGDSGGPLVYRKDDQQWLVGVTSYGHETCATDGVPAVYSRVDRYLPWLEETTSGGLVDLQTEGLKGDQYRNTSSAVTLYPRIANTSTRNDARNVGLRIEHQPGLSVSVPGLSCRSYTGYTDCRNSLYLALGQSSATYAVTLKASSRWADQVRVSPISDSYDYFSLRSEAFNLVFSNEPNVVLSLTTNRGSDGHVRVSALVRNAATHESAARVRVSFALPSGWQTVQLPENCSGSRTVQCGLGDLSAGQSAAQQLVLSGQGYDAMTVQVWTDNGDFPTGDSKAYTRPAQARSASTAPSTAPDSGGGGGGGGGSLSFLALLGLALVAARRLHQ